MSMQTSILHHGPRPRPVRIRKLRRAGVADLLTRLLYLEADTAETVDQFEHLNELSERAAKLAIGEAA